MREEEAAAGDMIVVVEEEEAAAGDTMVGVEEEASAGDTLVGAEEEAASRDTLVGVEEEAATGGQPGRSLQEMGAATGDMALEAVETHSRAAAATQDPSLTAEAESAPWGGTLRPGKAGPPPL